MSTGKAWYPMDGEHLFRAKVGEVGRRSESNLQLGILHFLSDCVMRVVFDNNCAQ
jgi:hypothetical protein